MERSRLSPLVVGLYAAFSWTPTMANYAVQLGAFAEPANASRLVQRLETAGVPVTTREMTTAGGQRLTRVIAGPFTDREAAETTLAGANISSASGSRVVLEASSTSSSRTVRTAPDTRSSKTDSDATIASSYGGSPPRVGQDPSRQPAREGTSVTAAEAERSGEALRLSGYFQTEAGYIYSGDSHWQKLRGVADVALDSRWNEFVKWKVAARGYYDLVFDVTDYYPDPVREDRQQELMFRETYLDIAGGNWDFRIGRQHIIWGEMVGLFVADVVSAQDQREFILPDFDWIRIPQWAARAEYFGENFHAEAIWIPYMTYDEIGKPGDDYFPYPLPPPPGYATVIRGDDRPSDSLDHSAGGIRLSWLEGGWDTSIFYYTSMSAAPSYAREIVDGPQPAFIYTPTHGRIHQTGLTVSKDFGLGVFRGEAVYTVDGLLETADLSDADGLIKTDYLDYILGIEFVTENETRLNFQFYQRWFTDYEPTTVPDEFESGVTAYVSTKAFHPDIEPEISLIRSLNRDDWLFRAKVTWRFLPNWRLAGGVDVLEGPVDGLVGRYEDADRVYVELRYSF